MSQRATYVRGYTRGTPAVHIQMARAGEWKLAGGGQCDCNRIPGTSDVESWLACGGGAPCRCTKLEPVAKGARYLRVEEQT